MRLVSVLILVAIVGGIAFVFVYRPDWISKAKKEGEKALQAAQGYTAAKTPREAMEQFLKAVKDRDYKAAAIYATSEYSDQLIKAHAAARELGVAIDTLNTFLDSKGFKNDKTTQLLFMLDPFPPYLKIEGVKEVKGKTVGVFSFDPPKITEGYRPEELQCIDPKLFVLYRSALGAPAVGAFEIKSEGQGEAKTWKIDFQVPQMVHDGTEYFLSKYKSYVEGLETFRGEVRQGRYLKDKIAPELLQILISSK